MKKGNDRSSAACHISIADDRKINVLIPCVGICCNKQLIGYKLCASVQIDGIYRLIRRKGNHLLYAGIQCTVDHVLRSVDIGLDCLIRVVFTGRNLL